MSVVPAISTRVRRPSISVGGALADAAVGGEIVRVLEPIGMDAALRAIEDSSETVRQTELALERARYEAGRAWRQ